MATRSNDILIIGAGLAGLSVAWHMQRSGIGCRIYEKEPAVGGLSRSKRIRGFVFDYDGHLLHFRQKYFLSFVRSLLDGNLVRHRRNAWVHTHGRDIRYPFQSHFHALPKPVAGECLSGFLNADRSVPPASRVNFQEWIIGEFGEGIAKHFMVPYNTKFWTVPPRELTCDWLDGVVPCPKVEDVVARAGRDRVDHTGYNGYFWYPRKGGMGQLARSLRKGLQNIHTNCEVALIDPVRKTVTLRGGETHGYDRLVSTVPLPQLRRMMKNIPKDIDLAFGLLRWNSIFNLNLGLRQKNPCDKHWIYFPQKDLSFFRVGFYHNFSKDLVPKGGSSLYAEVSYSSRKKIDKSRICDRIEKDLRKVGLIGPADEILCRDTNDIYYGYPVYDRNYKAARDAVTRFLLNNGIIPCGRYGSWRYMSMEDVIADGRKIVKDHFS